MGIFGAILDILNWGKDKLPIANRLEKIKNDIDKLERERNELLQGNPDKKKSDRIIAIDKQLAILRTRMQNACPDK